MSDGSIYDDVAREQLHDWLDDRELAYDPPDVDPDEDRRPSFDDYDDCEDEV